MIITCITIYSQIAELHQKIDMLTGYLSAWYRQVSLGNIQTPHSWQLPHSLQLQTGENLEHFPLAHRHAHTHTLGN